MDAYENSLGVVMATEPDEFWEDEGIPAVVALSDLYGQPVNAFVYGCNRSWSVVLCSESYSHRPTPHMFTSPDDAIDYLCVAGIAQ